MSATNPYPFLYSTAVLQLNPLRYLHSQCPQIRM